MIKSFKGTLSFAIPGGYNYVRVGIPKKGEYIVKMSTSLNQLVTIAAMDLASVYVVIEKDTYKWPDTVKESTWLYHRFIHNSDEMFLSSNEPTLGSAGYYSSTGEVVPKLFGLDDLPTGVDKIQKSHKTGRLVTREVEFDYFTLNDGEIVPLDKSRDENREYSALSTIANVTDTTIRSGDYVCMYEKKWTPPAWIAKGWWLYRWDSDFYISDREPIESRICGGYVGYGGSTVIKVSDVVRSGRGGEAVDDIWPWGIDSSQCKWQC